MNEDTKRMIAELEKERKLQELVKDDERQRIKLQIEQEMGRKVGKFGFKVETPDGSKYEFNFEGYDGKSAKLFAKNVLVAGF